MEWMLYDDGPWITVVLAMTELVKRLFRVRPRYVPMVPLAVAIPIGALLAWGEPWAGWATFVRLSIDRGLRIGAMAMAFYKLWRTTISGK